MVRKLDITWKHPPGQKEIPVITSDKKKTFCQLLRELAPAFELEKISLGFHDCPGEGTGTIPQQVILNGYSLNDLLREVAEDQHRCEGRRCEMDSPVIFPVINHGGAEYTSVPELLLRKVFIRAAGIT